MKGAPPGKLVILSGPSGVGKDTVIDAWRERDPRVRRVIAYTTRPMRPNEVPDADYHFVTGEHFLDMTSRGEFLEFKEVFGNYYGTPRCDMDRMLAEGLVAVLKIDVQGAMTVMELLPDAESVFILPPSVEELERRIRARNTDTPESIARRLQTARDEIALAHRYRHQIVNDSVEKVVDELTRLAAN